MPMQANLQAADTIDHVHEGVIYSPFHRRTSAKNINQQWSVWNGYASTKYYADAHLEYFSTRNTCGVFDVSPMRKYSAMMITNRVDVLRRSRRLHRRRTI